MRKSVNIFFLAVFVIAAIIIKDLPAQISVPGTPLSSKFTLPNEIESIEMPSFDLKKALAEDEFESRFKDIPPRFAKDFSVDFGYSNSGTINILAYGTKIWRLRIKSTGAMSINLIFNRFMLPKGSYFFVYSADKKHLLGAFTDLNNSASGKFSTAPCKGGDIILEYNAPLGTADPVINISKVNHDYKDIFRLMKPKDYGTSGACERNIICPEGDPYRNNVSRSVGMIIVGGIRNCTGFLVNNTRNDGTPFFLTANHCYDNSIETWLFMFRYESPNCANPGGDGPLEYTISGCTLLSRNAASDFCLVKLSSKPAFSYNAYYAGWNRSETAPVSGIGIHHPDGDVKKISISNMTFMHDTWSGTPDYSHWLVKWSVIPSTGQTAVTEPGSSGYPVFDQNKRAVGQLHGGSSYCGAPASDLNDLYGKFSVSWDFGITPATRLKDWLDSSNTGVMYLDGYDPNSGPLNTFNILSPSQGISVTSIPGSASTLVFNWDTASLAASYKWIFGNTLPARLLTIPVSSKPFILTLGQVDTYLKGIGVQQGASLSGAWDVWAFRNNPPANDSLKAINGPRAITFTRMLPVLNNFGLISPANNSRIEAQAASNVQIKFNWNRSGNGIHYKFFYASPDFSSPSNIKMKMAADNSGFDSLMTVSSGKLDTLLAYFGVATGDSTSGQWKVYAYTDNDSLASSQTYNVKFKRVSTSNPCIGSGSYPSGYPFYTIYEDSRTQMLYRASEIISAGGTAGMISKIGFRIVTLGGMQMNNFSVKMQTIAANTLSTWTTTGWTIVFSGSYYPQAAGLQYIELQTPYFWNGTGNLLVEICFDNYDYLENTTVQSTSQSGTVMHYHEDYETGCDMTGFSSASYRPNACFLISAVTGIGENSQDRLPDSYSLSQNFPNPFNPVTKINFAIQKQGLVSLKIYDILGREIRTLVNEIKQAGYYSVDFNGSDFASGVYFFRIESGSYKDTKRMMLVK